MTKINILYNISIENTHLGLQVAVWIVGCES